MNNLAIAGCKGRMGQRIVVLAITDGHFEVAALLEHPDCLHADETMNGVPIQTSISAIDGCDILIDFTQPAGTIENVRFCKKHGIKMVIGTTGFTAAQEQEISDAAEIVPIVFSANMSVGVNVLFRAVELLARSTPNSYTVQIQETHHAHKKDAPSGTAKTLSNLICAASGKEIGDIESIREGEIVGDHRVTFESDDDIIVIEHHAKTRDIFARGALIAAEFLQDKSKGLFTMRDVLNLNN